MNKIEYGMKLDFNNVLIRPKRSVINSRSEIDLSRRFKFRHSPIEWTGVPIMSANMDTTGTLNIYSVLKEYSIITALHKFYDVQDFLDFKEHSELDPNYFMISTGISDRDYDKLNRILSEVECNWICVDIANGYIKNLVDFCKKVREKYPNKIIVAGNVVTREMVEELILEGGVDIVKVGIGPGSACTTRLKTGVGMPQLSAIIECSDAAHGVNGHIISDGGITCPGDMAKAFGGGADFVERAQKIHFGSMEKYRASEGRVLNIPYRGSLHVTLQDYLGGLRSTCTYINAINIKKMPKCTTFIQVSQQLNNYFGG